MVQSMIEHECATDVVYIAATWGATEVIRPAAVAVAADRPSPRRPVQTATADLVGKHTAVATQTQHCCVAGLSL